jgi:predicted nuclease with TOPRIM domain
MSDHHFRSVKQVDFSKYKEIISQNKLKEVYEKESQKLKDEVYILESQTEYLKEKIDQIQYENKYLRENISTSEFENATLKDEMNVIKAENERMKKILLQIQHAFAK